MMRAFSVSASYKGKMIYIETHSKTPYVNLAYEEYFLKFNDLGDDLFMLWQNEPTIVVGNFQNTMAEINRDYVREHNIHVVRRTSGGGAVYHDEGNLCFSFILHGRYSPEDIKFSEFVQPVVTALKQLGIKAEISGRNDLTIDGAKFSGNAMRVYKDRILFHGTILYDSELDVLGKALKGSLDKLVSKGVKSIRSRVTNVKPHALKDMSILEFKENLKILLYNGAKEIEYIPNALDRAAIMDLAENKYKSWEWNYGKNPKAEVAYSRRYPGGKIEVYLMLKEDVIQFCLIKGDFLGCVDITEVEQKLLNVRYDRESVMKALDGVDFMLCFGAVTQNEVIDCIMGNNLIV